jgi:hypothetical protein
MSEQPYNNAFFDKTASRSLTSARSVLRRLFQYIKPKSIVDVGCGLGAWLKAANELGVGDVLGIDGDYISRDALLIPAASFQPADLRRPLALGRRFDLAITLEVAEHLPHHCSETFVKDLTALSDVVLFSAALPYQGGTEHINEQWLEFWAILFQRHGYVPVDLLRQPFWNDQAVEFWYAQNLMVFCTADSASMFPQEFLASGRPLSYPHPLTFLVNIARYRPLSASAVDLESEDYMNVLRAYQEGESTLPWMRTLDAATEAGSPLFPQSRTVVADARAEIAARDAEAVRWALLVEARDTEVARLALELERVRGEEARLTAVVAEWVAEATRLAQELAATAAENKRLKGEFDRELDRLSNELSVHHSAARQLTSQLSASKSEVSRLNEELSMRHEAFSRLSLALCDQVREARLLREEMVRQAANLQEAAAFAAETQRELDAMRNSLTWRMTTPVRQGIGWLWGSRDHRKNVV